MALTPVVLVDNLVTFAPNRGIWAVPGGGSVWGYGVVDFSTLIENPRWHEIAVAVARAFGIEPARLVKAVETAAQHWKDEVLVNACCGGIGPLAEAGDLTLDEYLARLEAFHADERAKEAARVAKKDATKFRRNLFAGRREELILQLLDAGRPYVCVRPGCGVRNKLTVDHIKPMSRGGSDDLDNLQFLCAPHNSAKGDRT
jgi:hypothetical protein